MTWQKRRIAKNSSPHRVAHLAPHLQLVPDIYPTHYVSRRFKRQQNLETAQDVSVCCTRTHTHAVQDDGRLEGRLERRNTNTGKTKESWPRSQKSQMPAALLTISTAPNSTGQHSRVGKQQNRHEREHEKISGSEKGFTISVSSPVCSWHPFCDSWLQQETQFRRVSWKKALEGQERPPAAEFARISWKSDTSLPGKCVVCQKKPLKFWITWSIINYVFRLVRRFRHFPDEDFHRAIMKQFLFI